MVLKMRDVLYRVDKGESNSYDIDPYELCESLGLTVYPDYHKVQESLKSYWVSSWICTDSYVGTQVYYLYGDPIAISHKPFRKSTREYSFVSPAAVESLKSYLVSCAAPEEDRLSYIDLEAEYPSTFKLSYNSQITPLSTSRGVYSNGKPVEIIEKLKTGKYPEEVLIKSDSSKERVVLGDLDFKIFVEDSPTFVERFKEIGTIRPELLQLEILHKYGDNLGFIIELAVAIRGMVESKDGTNKVLFSLDTSRDDSTGMTVVLGYNSNLPEILDMVDELFLGSSYSLSAAELRETLGIKFYYIWDFTIELEGSRNEIY